MKKKRETIRISKDELDKDYQKYLEQTKDVTIEVEHNGRVILVFDKTSYKRYKAIKAIREMYPNGLNIDPSDIR